MNDGDLGFLSPTSNPRAQPWTGSGNCQAGVQQGGKLVNQSGKSGKWSMQTFLGVFVQKGATDVLME